MRDMFGNEVTTDEARRLLKAKAKPQKRGYAAAPGSGPVGETCRSCAHYRSVNGGSKTFPKCNLMRASWNHSYGSDILAKAPACREWKPRASTDTMLGE
jgi:hypothetical protein